MTGAGLAIFGAWLFLAITWASLEYRQTQMEIAGKEYKADSGLWVLGVLFLTNAFATYALVAGANGASN